MCCCYVSVHGHTKTFARYHFNNERSEDSSDLASMSHHGKLVDRANTFEDNKFNESLNRPTKFLGFVSFDTAPSSPLCSSCLLFRASSPRFCSSKGTGSLNPSCRRSSRLCNEPGGGLRPPPLPTNRSARLGASRLLDLSLAFCPSSGR